MKQLTGNEGNTRTRQLWSADALAKKTLADFLKALSARNNRKMLTEYFRVTHYYARTLMLCREGFQSRNEALILATLANLISLDTVLSKMYQADSDVVPMALPLTEAFRNRFIRGLVITILKDSPHGLVSQDIIVQLNEYKLVGDIAPMDVADRLDELTNNGILERKSERYILTRGKPIDISVGNAVLCSLIGDELARELLQYDFDKPETILSRRGEFRKIFCRISGLNEKIAVLLTEVLLAFVDEMMAMAYRWRIRDLIHSGIPRPYQLEAYAVFRGYGYKNIVIEAPTGSGKTLIGMLCIQDWMRSMTPGEGILIIVPTVNYQQQWVKELCYGDFGLSMPPEQIYAGTPEGFIRFCRRTGETPAITILTYVGSTSFSLTTIAGMNRFVQGYTIKYVLLDEVHKVADDLESESAKVIAALCVERNRNTVIDGLIGFTGTAAGYSDNFEQLGLKLVHSIPMTDLIAAGFVAPFCEFGVPFAFSEREYRILHVLNTFKIIVKEFLQLIGHGPLRAEFAAIPIQDRVRIARDLFGMYTGRPNRNNAIESRLRTWESGSEISLSELTLLLIVQIITERSDGEMIPKSGQSEFKLLLGRASDVRQQLQGLVVLPRFESLLKSVEFGKTPDYQSLAHLMDKKKSDLRTDTLKIMATTIGGLYDGLSDWYRYTGEGRVAVVKTIIEAELKTRKFSGAIVFDHGKRLRRQESDLFTPGFAGVGGLFAQIIGTPGITPIAALSDEVYLPAPDQINMPDMIAAYIRLTVVGDELAKSIANLIVSGLEIGDELSRHITTAFQRYFDDFTTLSITARKSSIIDFDHLVLSPMREQFGHRRQGVSRDLIQRIKVRLRHQNPHLRSLLTTTFDYLAIVRLLADLKPEELVQAGGGIRLFYIIPMPGGRKKQLLYDLVARLVDDSSVPINMVIVSNWARTGWNVVRPNLLIDATATRNIIAWQQLRGRAMRARRTWTNACHDVLSMLSSPAAMQSHLDPLLPPDVHRIHNDLINQVKPQTTVDKNHFKILRRILTDDEKRKLSAAANDLDTFTNQEKRDISVRMMLGYNKVTHIYELIKAIGSPAQLMLDRKTGRWQRNQAIAEKHEHEISVDLVSGSLQAGAVHAPLIYSADPRHDSPGNLSNKIREQITDIDSQIVKAWMFA